MGAAKAVAVLALTMITANIEAASSSKANPAGEIWGNIRADAPIRLDVQGRILTVPAAYMMPWPIPTMTSGTTHLNRLRVAFWMPDGEPVTDRNPGERPFHLHRGSQSGTGSEIMHASIRFLDEGFDEFNKRPYLSPQTRHKNYSTLMNKLYPGKLDTKIEYGLLRVRRIPEGHYYINVENDYELQLDCGIDEGPSSVCTGEFYTPGEETVFTLRFRKSLLPQIPNAISKIKKLSKEWSL